MSPITFSVSTRDGAPDLVSAMAAMPTHINNNSNDNCFIVFKCLYDNNYEYLIGKCQVSQLCSQHGTGNEKNYTVISCAMSMIMSGMNLRSVKFLAPEDEVMTQILVSNDGVLGKFFTSTLEKDFAFK